MIPIKLTIRNFMCYRDNVPPLNFAGIHLACLSGDNGNGKSALIDAMTWALWGQARAKSDDDLIYSGQSEMAVEFDFAVGQQPYRIIRRRSRPRRTRGVGQTILELQTASGDGFKSMTGNSIAQTQSKITEILHMDYETFINSAYLRQGHADEFTVKKPVERKQVLADILGLTFYDELEGQAKDLAKQQATEKAQLENAIKDISDELAQKPSYEAGLAQAQSELSRIEATMKEKESELNTQRKKKESLEQQKLQLEQLEAHASDTIRDQELWSEQVKQHRSRLKEYEELIAQRPAIEDGYARFTEARRLSDELERKFRQMVNLERQKTQLDSRIREAGQSLLTEHALVQNRIRELDVKLQKLPHLRNEAQQVQAELRQLAEWEEALDRQKRASQELQTEVNRLEFNKTRLEREIKEIRDKLALLAAETEARCPLCETELGEEGLKLIGSKYAADEQSKSESLESNHAELTRKKGELESLRNDVSQLESRLNQEKTAAQGKMSVIKREMAEAEESGKQLAKDKERLGEVEEHLARRDFATVEQAALAEVEGELASIGYDADEHERVRHRLLELEPYDRSKQKLDGAAQLYDQEKEAAIRAEEAAEKLRRSLEADSQKRQELITGLAWLPQLLNDLRQAESGYEALAVQRNQARETMWSVKTKLERCAELEVRKKEKEGSLAQASKQESIYEELAEAFGKRGIQALLIEMVLPEIEVEANRLLGRMTDNRMHVKFETQRETKKGSVIETLDINISDELGTRNYEMFSGGEAFRINFAIRIALSKLLARRAGAPLPTLIIDEGFGTQDITGIEKLKEAINSIQDDFDKIIVITHIEELRDAFPTRIDVVKTAEGSTLSVS